MRELATEDRLTPVYPTTEGLGQKRLAGVIARALERLPAAAELELIPRDVARAVATWLRCAMRLLTVHRPPPDADVVAACAGPASGPAAARVRGTADPAPQPQAPARAGAPARRAGAARRRARCAARCSASLPFALTAGAAARARRDRGAIWRNRSRCCAWCRAMSAPARPWSPRWPRWPRSRPAARSR